MTWPQRLLTTGYFVCLLFSAAAFLFTPATLSRLSGDFPLWIETYLVALAIFAIPTIHLVLRDVRTRSSLTASQRRGWACLFLYFWPSVLVYLVRYEWMGKGDGPRRSDGWN